MARGNQRDKAREKNQKDAASQVSPMIAFALYCAICVFSSSADNPTEEEKHRTPSIHHRPPTLYHALILTPCSNPALSLPVPRSSKRP